MQRLGERRIEEGADAVRGAGIADDESHIVRREDLSRKGLEFGTRKVAHVARHAHPVCGADLRRRLLQRGTVARDESQVEPSDRQLLGELSSDPLGASENQGHRPIFLRHLAALHRSALLTQLIGQSSQAGSPCGWPDCLGELARLMRS